jgi:hypothetical protein
MSTSPISGSSLYQQLQTYFQERRADLSQLGDALKAGNMSAAEQANNDIVTLGQQGPFAGGAPFYYANRESDFQAIGQALQSGDLSAAQQAFQSLKSALHSPEPGGAETVSTGSPTPSELYQQMQAFFQEQGSGSGI